MWVSCDGINFEFWIILFSSEMWVSSDVISSEMWVSCDGINSEMWVSCGVISSEFCLKLFSFEMWVSSDGINSELWLILFCSKVCNEKFISSCSEFS